MTRCREARERLDLTLEEVARRAGISCPAVWRLDSGRTRRPTRRVREAVAQVLGLDPNELLAHDEDGNEDAASVREEASRAAAAAT